MEAQYTMKRALLILLLAGPVFAGKRYDFQDPKLNDELDANYKEHSFPNWINARGSSATITYISASTITVNGIATGTLTASTGTVPSFMVVGTATNDDAPVYRLGQYITSAVPGASAVTLTQSGNPYVDITSISLTPGDWELHFLILYFASVGVVGFSYADGGVGTVTGNDGTGLIFGDNATEATEPPSTAAANEMSVGGIRVSIATSKTYYLKALAAYSAGTAKAYGRISARRVR